MSIFFDLRQALENSPDGIARLTDPDTHDQFIIMSPESYQRRVSRVFDFDGTPPAEMVDAVMREDDKYDPYLDEYQD